MSSVLLRAVLGWTAAAILGSLTGCSFAPQRPPLTVYPDPPTVAPVFTAPVVAAAAVLPQPALDALVRPTARGRWVISDWSALPGWHDDLLTQAWPALLRSCERPTPVWAATCAAARALAAPDELMVRSFLRERLQPWRVEGNDGRADGLMTGYFEPYIEASRTPTARFNVPLHALPADLIAVQTLGIAREPWYTRAQIDSLPAAQAALRGREIAWVADPLDALLLQIQGSGRLVFTEPGGQRRVVRLAYAGHNQQPYQSVGRWLVEQGAFTLEQASWPVIRHWARNNPQRVREMLAVNPRYVFFREEPLPDPNLGPLGAQGVALIPGRSIAVDKDSVPYGTPVWIATTEPQAWSQNPTPARPLQRLVLAQDTGSAITGAVRADYFWGWGDGVEDVAGRTKQPLRMWVLWPRS
ncbi:MAG: murein transglycosylase A [Leptothrix sp. (in: b-proteobacteria)]